MGVIDGSKVLEVLQYSELVLDDTSHLRFVSAVNLAGQRLPAGTGILAITGHQSTVDSAPQLHKAIQSTIITNKAKKRRQERLQVVLRLAIPRHTHAEKQPVRCALYLNIEDRGVLV